MLRNGVKVGQCASLTKRWEASVEGVTLDLGLRR